MSQQLRFTAWLAPIERDRIEEEAEELGTTMNFIVRMAIREHFGLRVPYATGSQLNPEITKNVTPVTRHK